MFKRIFLFILILISTTVIAFSQLQNSIFLKGINGNEIKLSQLKDTSIKVTISNPKLNLIKGSTIYIYGAGFYSTIVMQISPNACLAFLQVKNIQVGTKITLEDLIINDAKTKNRIIYSGTTYVVVAD